MRVADKLASIVAGAHDQAATDAHYERVADGVTNYTDGIFDKARAGMLLVALVAAPKPLKCHADDMANRFARTLAGRA